MSGKRFYITTPIYYVNDVPHIGHAYTTLACDVMARFKRLDGYDVHFLTGTDEHGQKVEAAAAAAGLEPKAFTDRVSQAFRDLIPRMGYSPDNFIRTTEARHYRASQALWSRLVAAGDIYLGKYAGWYSVRDEAFYAEGETAVGDDGKRRATASGAEVEWVEEASYFFRLSAWQDRLLAFYEANPGFIAPESRRNEVISFVRGGLHDLSVSRTTFKWGVPVPGDPAHIMYVWLDALTNYITEAGYPDETAPNWKYWPADLHMVGKDIVRFHAVYWPAFLMSAGVAPPKRVFAHGWWTNEGQKISKSLGNVIDTGALVDAYGLDQTRYFLLREVPFGNDGDFRRDAMVQRMNSDLANAYGNLCQRVLSIVAKNCGAAVPAKGVLTEVDAALLGKAGGLLEIVRAKIDAQAFHEALIAIWEVIGDANRYVDAQAPWALAKTDPTRRDTVLWTLAETIRRVTLLAQPFMPTSTGRILDQLAVPTDRRGFDAYGDELAPGAPLPAPQGVFPRFVDPAAVVAAPPAKPGKNAKKA
ncbi:MAG: methionine--tRNA ligase [Rhodospirillales bacterium]|nr:methionine--tRNA ligase [Rhodospirillales bacterium]